MNHESPEATSRQPEGPSSPTSSNNPLPAAVSATDQLGSPEPPAVSESEAPAATSLAAEPDAGVLSPEGPRPETRYVSQMPSPRGSDSAGRGIQVGSRRNLADREPPRQSSPPKSTEVPDQELMESVALPTATAPIAPPSARDPLPPDLEREFAAAMGDASLEELFSGGASAGAATSLEMESRHRATVTHLHGDNVFLSLGGRNEGVVSLRQFPAMPALGAEMEVIVKAYLADEGLYELVIPGASAQVEDWSDLVEGTIVEARITGANTGGLECKVGSIRGFVPSSQIAMFRVEDYAEFIDQKMLCMVTEVNPRRKNLVLSRRAILEREREEARQQLLDSLQEGQVVDGVVRKLLDFGAFVDIGGVDGLVHISKLSWDHVDHPSEVLQEGQKIRAKIEKIDPQSGKISLSYRDLLDHPWTGIEEKFPVHAVVKGTVSRIAKFGAFVKLAPGVEGLVHISELSHGRVPNVGSVVSEGQAVDVKVVSIDGAAQRIALSIKAVLPEPQQQADEEDGATESPREPARAQTDTKRTQPLKGGVSGESGGGRFGLKW